MTQNTSKKCSENASKKVQNSKIFLPRGKGHPFPTDFILILIPILSFYKQKNNMYYYLINDPKNFKNML